MVLCHELVPTDDEGGLALETESDRGHARADFAREKRPETDAVQQMREGVLRKFQEVGDGRQKVGDARRMFGDTRLDHGWPFHDPGNAQAAFVDPAFVTTQTAGGAGSDFRQATVVAVEHDKRVLGDAELAQPCPQGADAAIHGDEFAVMIGRGGRQVLKGSLVRLAGPERGMRSAIPDDGEGGLLRGVLFLDET